MAQKAFSIQRGYRFMNIKLFEAQVYEFYAQMSIKLRASSGQVQYWALLHKIEIIFFRGIYLCTLRVYPEAPNVVYPQIRRIQ